MSVPGWTIRSIQSALQRLTWRASHAGEGRQVRTSRWIRAGQVAAGIGRLAPAVVLSLFLVVMATSFLAAFLGVTAGTLLATVWLLTGFTVLTRVGERAAVRAVLRYRPAPGSWLAADVAALTPGRRVQVYVAPALSGVFSVGGHSIAVGARPAGAGVRTPLLQAGTVDAVGDLARWRTRVQLPMLWWASPWLICVWAVGSILGPRLMGFMRVVAPAFLVAGTVISLGQGQFAAAGLGVVILADAILSKVARSRQQAQARTPIPTLAAA